MKEADGKTPKKKEGKNGGLFDDYDFGDKTDEARKILEDLKEEKIFLEFFQPSKEKLYEYLDTNPAPIEYIDLIGTFINGQDFKDYQK